MADTSYTNGSPPFIDADWLNDLNRLHYTIFGDPADLFDFPGFFGPQDSFYR